VLINRIQVVREYTLARCKNGGGDSIDYGVGLVVYQARVRFEGPNSVKLGESAEYRVRRVRI
jgi:hypothetical protein